MNEKSPRKWLLFGSGTSDAANSLLNGYKEEEVDAGDSRSKTNHPAEVLEKVLMSNAFSINYATTCSDNLSSMDVRSSFAAICCLCTFLLAFAGNCLS